MTKTSSLFTFAFDGEDQLEVQDSISNCSQEENELDNETLDNLYSGFNSALFIKAP